CIQVLEFPWTF
nr:immunoglobulin light chain junction region [Macaca mulatta]MOX98447.1 immunoglobulin light chain junction region [Macaca mulatta]MOX99397.1 immunoglobulin light chain junction region [Macaca mulatta]MOY00044.1 immunoglobulin light chain junction region [Macaca mulatta]MOY00711.1 immunoglobulin light chain junction region [Macaca mulatta]